MTASSIPNIRKTRVLVTGGAGFLGSHLCDALLAEGHEVVAVDNLLTGSLANLAHLNNEPRFDFCEQDVCRPFDLGPAGYIFHLASPASPVDYMQHGVATLAAGSLGTFHALDVARKHGARFLLASTSECYGDPLQHPQTEDYWGNVNPVGPRSVYDEAKRFAEATTMAYHRYYKTDTRIARIFNTYGPRMQLNDGRVIPNFIGQALRGEDLTVHGDGSQTRSFCYVTDLIDGLLRLAHGDEAAKVNGGQVNIGSPVNLGNPEEFTVLDCAFLVLHLTGSRSRIRNLPLPEDDPKQRRPDIAKARALLGWEPKVDLTAGLGLALEYFRQVLAAEQSMRAAS